MKPQFKQNTMETFRLISMTNFVLERFKFWQNDDNPDCQSSARYILGTNAYAKFLIQPLQLGMFVPCDENGNVLKEPKEDDFLYHDKTLNHVDFSAELEQYEKAKEHVLFNCFVFEESQKEALKNNTQLSVSIYTENSFYITRRLNGKWHTWFGLKTVEDLIKCKIELSKTAIKQIGL